MDLRAYLDMDAYGRYLTEACGRYEQTAPTVAEHCDDLYIRIYEDAANVTLAELNGVAGLWVDGWLAPNVAANLVYNLRSRLGMDTTGQAGF
jgi:hypothetical protein